ncbi:MAG: hypothetical protein M3Q42_04570 [Pseudomonadota bacterium]|nr:hypothetical protein [Pseudomonadota bacterium]
MYRTLSLTACALGLMSIAGCQERTNVVAPASQADQATQVAPQQSPRAAAATGELTLVQGQPGPYIADAAGSAVYSLKGDVSGEGCIDTCLEVWPPMLISESQPSVGAGLQPNFVSSAPRPDGRQQVTYGNKPLYRYAGDTGTGRTAGHGVEDKWGQWQLVGPQGEHLPVSQ